ncbi:alpha/beta fold hydrolase [Ruegeria faecimaris]|uniref:alpha/beta fold hydrolase n=1 Tax=Ruegeria faecimaris TaxID=686389 RepID=UPI002492D1C2|nr:alpha/beta hydrolase [Ruegeria faecimaris]
MTIFLTIALFIALFLVAMNLWTRKLTRDGRMRVPQPGVIIPVRGGNIHYVEKGDPSNQTVVLIHGLAGQLQHFTYALMDKLAEDFHVIAVDRPGCGYSTRETAELGRLPEQGRMIHEFLEAKGVSNPILVGHSLGGAVSLAMALDYPDKIKALALLAPLTQAMPGPPAVFKPLEIRTAWLRSLIGNTIAVPLAAKTAPHTLSAAFAPEPAPQDFLDRAGGALGMRPSAFISASQDVIGIEQSMPAQVARYGDLKVPGSILFGAQDALLSATQHGESMQAFGLSFEQIEGLGHMIPLTVPDICNNFIRGVVQNTEPRATVVPNSD